MVINGQYSPKWSIGNFKWLCVFLWWTDIFGQVLKVFYIEKRRLFSPCQGNSLGGFRSLGCTLAEALNGSKFILQE